MIEGLRDVATEKIESMLAYSSRAAGSFLTAMQGASVEVLTTHNETLLKIISEYVINHIGELVDYGGCDAFAIPIIQYLERDIIKDILTQRQALEEDLEDSEAKYDVLKNDKDDLSFRNYAIEEELEICQETSQQVKGQLDTTTYLLHDAEEENVLCKNALDGVKSQLEFARADLEDTKVELEHAKTKLESTKAELEKANARIESLERSAKEIQNSIGDKPKQLVANFDELIEVFNRVSICRSTECKAQISINCYITRKQRSDPPFVPEYDLRCGRCKCRQKPG